MRVRFDLSGRLCAAVLVAAIFAIPGPALAAGAPNARPAAPAATVTRNLQFADSRLAVTFSPGEFRVTEQELIDWVLRSARATATYFGRFPSPRVQIAIEASGGAMVTEAITHGTPQAHIRIVLGRHTTREALLRDTTMVHEMTHLAFPDLDDVHLWLHEGIASYVEVVASAQASEMTPAAAWHRLSEELPLGLPGHGDHGLDDTPSEDRRYWGGALFCLTADLEIRKQTSNRLGLKDALRAILAAGGTLASTWTVERALGIGDRAVGGTVLRDLYTVWKDKPITPDLEALWQDLGVRKGGGGVQLVDAAPLAPLRRAITQVPDRPLLLVAPALVRESAQRH